MDIVNYLTRPFFNYLPSDLAAIGAAMVWGQKQQLSPLQYQIFQKTGLLHLLVLSGQNITLLVGFFNGLGGIIGYRIKLTLTILVALFYLVVFHGDPPIVRASLMAIYSALVIFQQKFTPPLYVLGFITVLLLAIFPAWLTSVSFWLSVSATAGIYLFYPYFQRKYRFRSGLAQTFFLSLSAQILTTPILLLVFRELPLLTLPMNILVAWLVEPIMFFGVLMSLFGQIIQPVTQALAFIMFGLLQIMNYIVLIGYQVGERWMMRI